MGSVSYLPNKATLGKDFNSAIQYLIDHDPLTLVMLRQSQKEAFVQEALSLFFNKIDHTHRHQELVLDAARANIHLLISAAEMKREKGYSDIKVREHWCRDVPAYIGSVMSLATAPSLVKRDHTL